MDLTVELTMVDDVKVVVPDSVHLITPYVLREQHDWFEDEIKFLRRLLQPGWRVIDIGANYGLYTLSMAAVVGDAGHVWAFEPASATAEKLTAGIAANGYDHVTLEQCAMSSVSGTAQLSVHGQSELNSIVQGDATAQSTETVRVDTLDAYAEKNALHAIDFIKLDAEGEEANILKGGSMFFADHSPLVQYEIKAGKHIQLDLVQAFTELGYDSWRLVPGLDVLVPFRADVPADRFLLNLFACKPDRADRLSADGWLVDEVPNVHSPDDLPQGLPHDVLDERAYDWRTTVATLPYGKKLAAAWERTMADEDTSAVEEALALYALSRDEGRPASERFMALDCSFRRFRQLVEDSPSHPRLASLARVARDYGARTVAIDVLRRLCGSIVQDKRVDLDEPFLVPAEHYATLQPGEAIGSWMMAGAADELQRLQAFSSFYSGLSGRESLEMICRSEFASPESRRRLDLLQKRFGLPGSASMD